MEDILKGLDQIDEKLVNLEKDNKASQSAIKSEIERLGKEQLKLSQALAEIEQHNLDVPKDMRALSLGESFVKSADYTNFSKTRNAYFDFSKAASTTQASNSASRTSVAAPYLMPGMLTLPDMPLSIENLFPHVPVSSDSIQYVKEGAMTNNAAVVAEAASKPETTFTAPKIETAQVVTVAHWARITKQLSADSEALASYIDSKLQYGLSAKIEEQLVSGEGGATALPGLLHSGNYTDPSDSLKSTIPAGSSLFDFALFLKAEMEKKYFSPEVFLLNPADWTALATTKDKQGRYLLAGPQALATKSLWGVPVLTSGSIPAGKYLMLNPTLAGTIYDRESMSLAVSESDDKNFTQNLITIRVERRLGFAIEQVSAVYGGEWKVPANQ